MIFFGYNLSLEFTIVCGVLLFAFLIQVVYYSVFFKVSLHKNREYITQKFPVSIIICARNESINLQKNLPVILEQDYPDFEVIVVNDASEDDTDMVIASLKLKYDHLKTTAIVKDKKFTHGKKLALTVGIKAAKNEWMIFTDADCKPNSKDWLYTMQHNFTEKTEIVLGYGGYRRRKGLLDKFIRFDTLFIAMHYLGLALAGKPFSGVGRNMAYKKSLYNENKGFSSHSHILSGDDDLFINQVANKNNTRVEAGRESIIVSEPVKSWQKWFYQKKRHLSTFPLYRRESKIYLGLEIFSRFLFYGSFVWLLLLNQEIFIVLGIFMARFLYQLVVIKSVMKRLNEKDLLLFSPFMDLLIPIINFIVIISNNLAGKSNKW